MHINACLYTSYKMQWWSPSCGEKGGVLQVEESETYCNKDNEIGCDPTLCIGSRPCDQMGSRSTNSFLHYNKWLCEIELNVLSTSSYLSIHECEMTTNKEICTRKKKLIVAFH